MQVQGSKIKASNHRKDNVGRATPSIYEWPTPTPYNQELRIQLSGRRRQEKEQDKIPFGKLFI